MRNYLGLLTLTVFVSLPHSAYGQYFDKSGAMNSPGTSDAIQESSEADHHTLAWTTTGTPTACTVTIEEASTSTGTWSNLLKDQDCTLTGSSSLSGVKAEYVRINLKVLSGGSSPSVAVSYVGMGPSATLWTQLDNLRSVEAYRHGITDIQSCPGSVPNLTPNLTDADFQLYQEPFGTSLDVAASFGDTGANGIPSAQGTIQTEALGQLQFESEHYGFYWRGCIGDENDFTASDGTKYRGWRYRYPNFSFGGTIGLRPALVLENLTSTAAISNPTLRPMFQDAFGWSLTPRLNWVTSHRSQLAAFGTIGENYLLSQVTSFKEGDNTVTATPISNNVGQSALYWEGGLEWKLLNTDIVNAYINKTDVLDPPFEISLSYRNDTRFRRAGDLPSTYSTPEGYLVFRFNVGLNKILNWNTSQVEPSKGYTFKFGVDYEKPVREGLMPTATVYYVTANIDLMQIFKPSAMPTPPSQSQTPAPAPHATLIY